MFECDIYVYVYVYKLLIFLCKLHYMCTHKIQACLYTRTHFFIRDERGKKLGFESVKC